MVPRCGPTHMCGSPKRRACCGLTNGRLVFLTHSVLAYLTVPDIEADGPADERLKRPQFGMHRITWPDDVNGSVEFHLAHGDWIRLLRSSGFEIEDLIEVQVPPDATPSHQWMSPEWARRWPCEDVWKARKCH